MANLNDIRSTLRDIVDEIRRIREGLSISLTEYTRDANIISKVYIEKSIINDEIAIPLMATLNQMYVGFVMTALGLNTYVDHSRTVRDRIRTISTESYIDALDIIENNFSKLEYSTEASGPVKLDTDVQKLVVGRIVEMDMGIPSSKDGKIQSMKVYLNVMLIPNSIDNKVAEQVIAINYSPPISQRLRRVMAGEIKFWKDFVLAQDLIKQHKEALKHDKSGILYEMSKASQNALAQTLLGLFIEEPKHNLANSILIIDKVSFKKACTQAGINFDDYITRQKFFVKSMMMMIVVVDTMYNLVEMYFNGLKNKGEYTYNMINKAGKEKSDVDMKNLMTMYAQGIAPTRF